MQTKQYSKDCIYPPEFSFQLMVIIQFLFAFSFLTSSFDIFANVRLAGFNFRATQIAQMFLIGIGFFTIGHTKKLYIPLGFPSLFLWTAFIILFVPNTTYLPRSLGYALWLIIDVFMVLCIPQFFKDEKQASIMFKMYLLSFVFMAVIAIIQMPLGLLGIHFFHRQWMAFIPRCSGFSYEPSYYGAYMLTGWTMFAWLIEKRCWVLSRRKMLIGISLITLAMLFSTSRIAIGFMGLYTFFYAFKMLSKLLMLKKISVFDFSLSSAIAVFGGIFVSLAHYINSQLSGAAIYFMAGTGFAGRSNHSVEGRTEDLSATWEAFERTPWLGTSLGGVATNIAEHNGIHVTQNLHAKWFEGMTIAVEALAASGIIGYIPFVWFFGTLFIKPYKRAKKLESKADNAILMSAYAGLVMAFIILQFNQNILRPFFWVHITILVILYRVLNKTKKPETADET